MSVPRLDWKQYFLDFCEHHGGYPVEVRGRLLFRDGWQYSATDYAGPEYEPPEDALPLVLEYWTARRSVLWRQLMALRMAVSGLKEAQRARSRPLVQVRRVKMDGGSSLVRSAVDFSVLDAEVSSLEKAVCECDSNLTECRIVKRAG